MSNTKNNMQEFIYEDKVMWAQLDANMHLRHSAYADFAAQARLELLNHLGIDMGVFAALRIGPILFREELIYLKEVRLNDTIRMSCVLTRCRKDGSRWSFRQELFRGDGTRAAVINVDGAWIDHERRKLAKLPEHLVTQFLEIPKSDDFTEEAE